MVCLGTADSGGSGGGLGGAGGAAISFAVVGAKAWASRTGAMAVGFRASMAAGGRVGSPDFIPLPWAALAAAALLQPGYRGRGHDWGELDFVAGDSLVLAAHP